MKYAIAILAFALSSFAHADCGGGNGSNDPPSNGCNGGQVGPAGPAGPVGPSGPQGPVGLTGLPGVAGPAGPQGLTGPTGAVGTTGAQGVQGPAGQAGTSIFVSGDPKVNYDPYILFTVVIGIVQDGVGGQERTNTTVHTVGPYLDLASCTVAYNDFQYNMGGLYNGMRVWCSPFPSLK